MKWLETYTKSSTIHINTTFKEHFESIFDFIDNEELKGQLLSEVSHYMQRDDLRIQVKSIRSTNGIPSKNSKDIKKQANRDVRNLKRLIQDDATITNNEHYLDKAQEVLIKHFGKYEIKHIDIKNLADILNSIRQIKAKKTLVFDTTTEYQSYKKSDKNNISLKSQMESVFIEHGYYKKITTYFQDEHKAKNPLKPFNLHRQPPPKTMYKYVVTKEVNKAINDFLKEIHIRDSRK